MILSFAAGFQPVNTGPRLPVIVAASTLPCSNSGATRPNTSPMMLDAFADREDITVRRLHVVVDDDAAIDF